MPISFLNKEQAESTKVIMSAITHRKGSSLISLLIALVIVGLIFWIFTQTKQQNTAQGTMMKDAGIDTSSYKAILDSARKVANDASKPKQ